ncbi:phosphodiesterase [Herbivorax sp. ANBcel31]|uniref:phosphodiesterase n=1 Tax=Herbivorax sp. ANBcel31 TaxID=3069754 RepID=UPI0027B2773F|nr:phosphodiesterase [Herbivorax sp. ANBcel31]MDQ2087471.1 phosphodiesterase [Herbivorax sp. ANBcel31]
MKLFFISDMHGSIYYTKKAIEIFESEKFDYMIILGDQLYHGARNPLPKEYNPKEVSALLNQYAHKIVAVRGNCDSEVDEMVLDYPISLHSTILYNNKRLFITHGHIYNGENLPKLKRGDVLIYGHTHIPKAEKTGDICIINPGSISMPKENNPNTYGVLDSDIFKIKDLEGNTFKEIQLT